VERDGVTQLCHKYVAQVSDAYDYEKSSKDAFGTLWKGFF
jgi:hypothetical protein